MQIKKSAMLFLLASVSSVGLLIFSAAIAPASSAAPAKCTSSRCCSKSHQYKTFSTWDIISQIMLRPAG